MAILIALLGLVAAPVFAADVGFTEVKIPNGAEPPLTAGIWFPTNAPATSHSFGTFTQTVALDAPIAGNHLPLVVMSHGGGGWYSGHYDTALALAHAGFVAAAVSHAGDTFDDQSRVLQLWRRPAQLHRLVDYMLDEWRWHKRLDAARIGAFGFSNGGFTVSWPQAVSRTFRKSPRFVRSIRIMICVRPCSMPASTSISRRMFPPAPGSTIRASRPSSLLPLRSDLLSGAQG
jgi:predicted dienelactone hydrolase